MLIELTCDRNGWRAVFYGGDMPQRIPLPLPYTYSASAGLVRAELIKRFPNATIEVVAHERLTDILNRIERL